MALGKWDQSVPGNSFYFYGSPLFLVCPMWWKIRAEAIRGAKLDERERERERERAARIRKGLKLWLALREFMV